MPIIRLPDEDGKKDWLLEFKDDIIVDQYRYGVSGCICMICFMFCFMFQEFTVNTRILNQNPRKWPNGVVPYLLSNCFNEFEKRVIERAMKYLSIQTDTCVTFVRRNVEPDYVFFTKMHHDRDQLECASTMGKSVRGGKQIALLNGKRCFESHSLFHLLLHLLGFDHVENRHDRDNFIQILTGNINLKQKALFDKRNMNNELVGFDYESIMLSFPISSFQKWINNYGTHQFNYL